MSIHLVDVEHLIHTCPGSTEPHPVATVRTVVHVTPGGSCRAPVTVRCADTVATVPCGRHEPAERQCGACRTIVVEHAISTRDLGRHASSGVAA